MAWLFGEREASYCVGDRGGNSKTSVELGYSWFRTSFFSITLSNVCGK